MKKFYFSIFCIFIISIFYSCSKKTFEPQNIVIFPAPPDTTRIQYLTSIGNSESIEKKQNRFTNFIVGKREPLPINKPYGISASNGKIYICDDFIKGLEIITLNKNKFECFIPEGKGQLKNPINCFVDSLENIYIADVGRMQIVVFNKNREYVDAFGETENYKPCDVNVCDNKIWVADLKGQKIKVYSNDSEHKLLLSFPESQKGDEDYLFQPTNIFVTNNKVYVTDFGDFKIKMYDHNGKYLDFLGGYGKGLGQFVRPKGISVDKDENLYVVDAGFENVQIFNKDKQLLMFFGGSYKGPGYMYLPAKVFIDYNNLSYFEKYVDSSFKLKYLIFVTNQFGPDKVSVYGHVEQTKK